MLTALAVPVVAACAAGGAGEEADAASPAPVVSDVSDVSGGVPRLAVMIVIDQLRPDLVTRYDELWTGGLRRLVDDGFAFRSASHAHAFTETAAGHTTIATGVRPGRHGIVANNWREPRPDGSWRTMYAVGDADAPVLGAPDAPGRSPANLRAPAFAEWLRAAHPGARVVAISRKDRGAIPLAGKVPDAHVYWIDRPLGRFVTSTWYRDAYPEWVERTNREVVAGLFADTVWESGVPPAEAWRSRPDTFPMEGAHGVHPAFTHRAQAEMPEDVHEWLIHSPAPDSAVLALAVAALDAEELGRDATPDLLALSFSQVDYVGHWYGPMSREQLDNMLRLDRLLGHLFEALDRRVGEGRWVAAFTSDHGVLPYPEWLQETEGWGMRLGEREEAGMRRRLEEALGEGAATPEQLTRRLAEAAEALDIVARAYTQDELRSDEPVDSFAPLYRNALLDDRAPGMLSRWGVELRLEPGVLADHADGGTTHGSPYWYDRHVPLIFLGAGVSGGGSDEAVETWDVAPTLAELVGIPQLSDIDGRSLAGAWKGR